MARSPATSLGEGGLHLLVQLRNIHVVVGLEGLVEGSALAHLADEGEQAGAPPRRISSRTATAEVA